ncbi:MAG: Asp-tRNA(Asn)/Glu-tRNA(Gln) amidotransferase subunit GatC [Alphaproteobacteria bacterium]|mgnify:FL=1|jgi:aspartyl-tRNA(Asn)/glutamyl-tRNA(Gln) amidotransferase subunit C
MSIDKATVAKIARLARIHVAEEKQAALAGELSNILGWVEQLSEVDTDDVAPMTSVVEVRLPEREDVITDGDCRDDILANAPETDGSFFVVPKVVE